MFQFMNTLLQQPQELPQSAIINNEKSMDTRKTISKLQSEIDKAQTEYTKANEAYRRNKGSPIEARFRTKLKDAATRLQRLKELMDEHQNRIKSVKEKQKMYTF
jgi:uncharacterized phage infection (PIP) family protein YhgE